MGNAEMDGNTNNNSNTNDNDNDDDDDDDVELSVVDRYNGGLYLLILQVLAERNDEKAIDIIIDMTVKIAKGKVVFDKEKKEKLTSILKDKPYFSNHSKEKDLKIVVNWLLEDE